MEKLTPTALLAEQYVSDLLKRSPETSTMLGEHDYDHLLDDYSLEAMEKELAFNKEYLEKFKSLTIENDKDALTLKVIISDLEGSINSLSGNFDMLAHGVINSPMSELKELFEFMEYSNQDDYLKLLSRLNLLPQALTQWIQTLTNFQSKGIVNSKRNVKELTRQALTIFQNQEYSKFLEENLNDSSVTLPKELKEDLKEAAAHADTLHFFLATTLENDLLTKAREQDGVGSHAYPYFAEQYTYPNIDLQELYDYGLTQVEEISQRMHEVAGEILPNYSSLSEVANYLNSHPNYRVVGKENLVAKLRAFTDDAISMLNGVEFDIPSEILNIDILLNEDSIDASPYYTPPSEDLSRPGATWFPTLGKDEFTIWGHLSTWYHEGVPGHHLQCGTQALQGDNLTRYQKSIAWHSGYGEGWALYSEKLMDELGFFIDPGYLFGYLQSQMLRAARIVIDLGLHCNLPNPEGEIWEFDNAVKFLIEKAMLDTQYALSEVNRYLSTPGQAISYKVGERIWLKLRENYKLALRERANVKLFHAHALSLGSMPLEVFQLEMNSWIEKQRALV